MTKFSDKDLEVQRNHHYVWSYYMKFWASKDKPKEVWHLDQRGAIHQVGTKAINVEQDFYKSVTLTQAHMNIIRDFSGCSPEFLQEKHKDDLTVFPETQTLKNHYHQSNKKDVLINKVFAALESKTMEKMYTDQENAVRPIIDSLANEDISVLNDKDNMEKFMLFIGHQTTRTKSFRNLFTNNNSAVPDWYKKLLAECSWIISYMIGINIGYSFFTTRHEDTHTLLVNDTDIAFITSDNPSINVHPSLTLDSINDQVIHCDNYFPISP
ncbi:DUF4238 domain-containing protein [Shewanella sp. 202IG2-18]|uniref:DUF4238 domain-containing protein n=1 Tax=Parashewanella hymeniacidonis TaxID=2807618 RepID=UPI00195FE218|nr:DUF4238 domain-containing protein [Parashewanella hymeniacidonis]MBM7071009.1 DUF4238 domain-containing protein [Parashewanella hymeniacidonis]